MIEQILANDTVQLRVAGKLTKFRGHKEMTDKPRKLLSPKISCRTVVRHGKPFI